MKLALSMLCENPARRTGLTTLFHEFVAAALVQRPTVKWVVFAGPDQEWTIDDPRVEVVRRFPANNHRVARLAADHFRVGPAARARGADALLTVGFVPLRAAGVPVIMHLFSVQHLGAGGGWAMRYRRWAVARGMGRARLVIANSRWTAQRLAAAYPTRRDAVLVSHEGLQHERFRPDGARGRADLPVNYLLWTGNFYPYKRVELALAAFAALPPELRLRFPLVLAGGDWGGRTRAEAVARALGVAAHTRFVGWVSDAELPALYRGARALVLSTAEETFGRNVAEALACGCPCVLQDLAVLREVTDGVALFVDFTRTPAAADALQRVCTDDVLAARLGRDGLRRAAAFSFDRLATERIDAIASALGGAAHG